MNTLRVNLGERSYSVHIGRGLLDRAGRMLRERLGACTCAIVTDDNVAPLYLRRVKDSLDAAGLRYASIILPHGERTKSLAYLEKLYAFFAENGITRRDTVVALGGGVIGDLAGLAAATWLRGVRFVQIPTTLLAQVDSSVGGKVAVDLPQGKNLVGAFWQPAQVIVDPDTLRTLPDEIWRDGLGEVVKYGCINDAELFAMLESAASGGRDGVMTHIDEILTRCIGAKAAVVEQDEHDTGLRMTLNFGHTIAHAIEAVQRYEGLRHGEAVAAGMAEITRLSEDREMTEPGTYERLIKLEKVLGLPCELPDITEQSLLSAVGMDKKKSGKQLNIVLLKRIGECFVYPAAIDWFHGLQGK